jgi:hypothetical protein
MVWGLYMFRKNTPAESKSAQLSALDGNGAIERRLHPSRAVAFGYHSAGAGRTRTAVEHFWHQPP